MSAIGAASSGAISSSLLARPILSFWRYWFRPGGEISLGVVRIAIFAAMLIVLLTNFSGPPAIDLYLQSAAPANYIPKGILKLLGLMPFSATFMHAVWWASLIAIWLALVGFITRPAMIVATLGTLILASFKESFGPYWSHGYNVCFMAALAFMFGPAGASLSVDRILNRLTGWWPPGRDLPPGSYYWPVLAAQIAVAFFYFGAFWAKLYNGGLYWAIGDNMRIMVGITWDHPYFQLPKPFFINYLLEHPWFWQFAAVAHLITQALPLTAAFFIHRPALRLFEAAVFVGGVYGLYHVMTVWNPAWLWLGAVFVDWEWIVALARRGIARVSATLAASLDRLGSRARGMLVPASYVPGTHGGNPPQVDVGPATRWRVLSLGYVVILLGYTAYVFGFQLAHKHKNYPFSSFDFYSTVYSHPPFNEHKHYTFMAGGIRVRTPSCSDVTTEPRSATGQAGVVIFACKEGATEFDRRRKQNSAFFELYRSDTVAAVEGAVGSVERYIQAQYPGAVPPNARVELLVRLWQYPPYPAPMSPRVEHEALRGVKLPDGRVLTALGSPEVKSNNEQAVVVNAVSGFRKPVIKIYGYRNAWYAAGKQPRIELPGKWSSPTKFDVDMEAAGRPLFTTIGVREEGSDEEFEFWGPILY